MTIQNSAQLATQSPPRPYCRSEFRDKMWSTLLAVFWTLQNNQKEESEIMRRSDIKRKHTSSSFQLCTNWRAELERDWHLTLVAGGTLPIHSIANFVFA